jgi:hypothetical protein
MVLQKVVVLEIAAGAKPLGVPLQPYPHEYTDCPSGWLMKAAFAVRLKVGPVIPGAAAYAVVAMNNNATATIGTRSCRVFEIAFFMFVALIVELLIDMDLGHQPAEIFGVVR